MPSKPQIINSIFISILRCQCQTWALSVAHRQDQQMQNEMSMISCQSHNPRPSEKLLQMVATSPYSTKLQRDRISNIRPSGQNARPPTVSTGDAPTSI
jgi:hypothetical protein